MQVTCPTRMVDKFIRRRCFIIDKFETDVGAEIHFRTTVDADDARRGPMQIYASKETKGVPDGALHAAGQKDQTGFLRGAALRAGAFFAAASDLSVASFAACPASVSSAAGCSPSPPIALSGPVMPGWSMARCAS